MASESQQGSGDLTSKVIATAEDEIAYFVEAWEKGIETGIPEFDALCLYSELAGFLVGRLKVRGFHDGNSDLPNTIV